MFAPLATNPQENGRSPFLMRIALPAIAAVVALALLLIAVVLFAAGQTNSLAGDQQENVVRTLIKQRIADVAYEQEGVTIWDDAVRQVRAAQLDGAWLDDNLGVWMQTYYGHEEVYILDDGDRPIYAMRDHARRTPGIYDNRLHATAAPLVAALRARLRGPWLKDSASRMRSPGSVDLAIVGGHPAIVSVKPILSDSVALRQEPGKEYLHVSVRRLDGSLPATLANEYHLEEARFAAAMPAPGWSPRRAAPLANAAGKTIGYLVWHPFSPGALMARRIAPYAIIALLAVLAMVVWLLQRIQRGTLALEASQARAEHLAFHDPLTGLSNRALFDERLARALLEAQRSGASIALLYFDLDRFKTVNDTFGHPMGDELIATVARRLLEATRATDVVARIGGDEFAIIQMDVKSAPETEVLCMRIVEAIDEPFLLAGNQVNVGVSIGVAFAPGDASCRTELARKADIALYEAKASGRGRYVFFAEHMDANIRQRREIECDLRAAIEAKDQFEVAYQPLYAAQSQDICGAEALLRWNHPSWGTMSPAAFIPIAEATGTIEAIGEWVLERACRDAVRLGLPLISVNVSAVQLRNDAFAARVLAIVAHCALDPSSLELEITETSFLESPAVCRANLANLRSKGVKIALDDFGTGYSSFSHLRHFDVDRIKIDRSFVNGIDIRQGGSAIIRAIVDLAKASGMQVTAEGVETEEQRHFLTKVGCTTLQGYLLSRPMSVGHFAALLNAPRPVAPQEHHNLRRPNRRQVLNRATPV